MFLMPASHLDDVLDLYRAGDHHECARRLRMQLEHDPFAPVPRLLLAHVLARLGQAAPARVHWEKLLPVAVGRGDLYLALALQRRLDEIEGHGGHPERYAAMHRWFRLLGEGNLVAVPRTVPVAIPATTLLRMPVHVFVHVAQHLHLESFEAEPHTHTSRDEVAWHVLWGAGRWRAVARNGRPLGDGSFDSGHQLGGPAAPLRGKVLFSPDTPGERLRFDGRLLELIAKIDPDVAADPLLVSDLIREHRPAIPHGRKSHSDFDHPVRPGPLNGGVEPPRLDVSAAALDHARRDTGDWIEQGQIELGGPVSSAHDHDPGDGTPEIVLPDTPMSAAPEPPTSAPPDPGAHDRQISLPPPQRRTEPRIPVSFSARVALLGIGRPDRETLVGDVVDLSMGGVGLRFPRTALTPAITMLQDEALRVDLITLAGGFLQLAGRVRWIDFGNQGSDSVAAGVQFALLTDADREAIARLVMDADPGLDTSPPAA